MTRLWKSCLSALVFILTTAAFLRNWQITGYLDWCAPLPHFNEKHPHLSQMTEGKKRESKEPHGGAECDLSSKAKIYPRKFQPKWKTGTENVTCLRIGWLENICHQDKQWERLNKKSAKKQERIKIWFFLLLCLFLQHCLPHSLEIYFLPMLEKKNSCNELHLKTLGSLWNNNINKLEMKNEKQLSKPTVFLKTLF